jgi:hypothetical protein
MKRRVLLAIVCSSAATCTVVAVADGSVGEEPPPPETILSAPPVEAVGKAPPHGCASSLRGCAVHSDPLDALDRLWSRGSDCCLPIGADTSWFVTYRSRAGRLCGVTFESQLFSSGCGTGGLACTEPCGQICASGGFADRDAGWLAYSATAPTSSDGFRLTLTDGSRLRCPLTGPSVRGAPGRRLVLAQVTTKASVVLAEALRGDEVIASQAYAP